MLRRTAASQYELHSEGTAGQDAFWPAEIPSLIVFPDSLAEFDCLAEFGMAETDCQRNWGSNYSEEPHSAGRDILCLIAVEKSPK